MPGGNPLEALRGLLMQHLAPGKVIAFHGTRSDALQSILDNGILAHPFKRYHPSRFYQGQRGSSVYVTEDPEVARGWAMSEVDDPSKVTILELELPKEALVPDEEAQGAERYPGDIPPEWIINAIPLASDGSYGQPVELHEGHVADDEEVCQRFAALRHKPEDDGATDQTPLDPDLLEIAEGKPQNIVQEIYALQAERDKSRAWQTPSFSGASDAAPTVELPGPSLRAACERLLVHYHVTAPAVAMDRASLPRPPSGDIIAMDRASLRTLSKDGHLHVKLSNISKATINPYWGHEIPDYEGLGLDPDKKYMLLRHPDELKKAAKTFNNLPILAQHVPINAARHRPDLVVGSTGTDGVYQHPYLRNSMAFWTQPAIDAIEKNKQRELSAAYHYKADLTPGTYEGKHYDGVMRNIIGNHVALVPEGRAGSDVRVAA